MSGSSGAELLTPFGLSSGGRGILGSVVLCLPLIMLSFTLICSLSLSCSSPPVMTLTIFYLSLRSLLSIENEFVPEYNAATVSFGSSGVTN